MDGRTCSKCNRYKAASNFPLNGEHPDGSPRLKSVCKDCTSERTRAPWPEPHKCTKCKKTKPPEDFCGQHPKCRKCANEQTYVYRRGPGKKRHNARMVTYNRERYRSDPMFRLITKARQEVCAAIRLGVLKRPEHCPKCRRKVKVHGHHYKGYDKPNWLKVKWLCARCHFKEDAKAHRAAA